MSNVQVDLVKYVGESVVGNTHYTHYEVSTTPAPKKSLPAQRSYNSFNNYLKSKPPVDLKVRQEQEVAAIAKAILKQEEAN